MIAILDYGLCNIGSVTNMLNYLGVANRVVGSSEALSRMETTGLILPGVGNFGRAMQALSKSGLGEVVHEARAVGTPVLGICLGMQMLARFSEEADCDGLGILDAVVKKFSDEAEAIRIIPNMGWAPTKFVKGSALCNADLNRQRFYFVHSYHMVCKNRSDVLAVSRNGEFEFTAAVANGSVFGCQFHPEKSHRYGKKLLANFAAHCASKHV